MNPQRQMVCTFHLKKDLIKYYFVLLNFSIDFFTGIDISTSITSNKQTELDVITSVNSANGGRANQCAANFDEYNEYDENEPSTTNGLYFVLSI